MYNSTSSVVDNPIYSLIYAGKKWSEVEAIAARVASLTPVDDSEEEQTPFSQRTTVPPASGPTLPAAAPITRRGR
jgi:hypothetical protein